MGQFYQIFYKTTCFITVVYSAEFTLDQYERRLNYPDKVYCISPDSTSRTTPFSSSVNETYEQSDERTRPSIYALTHAMYAMIYWQIRLLIYLAMLRRFRRFGISRKLRLSGVFSKKQRYLLWYIFIHSLLNAIY
jgi:hypothetical protein